VKAERTDVLIRTGSPAAPDWYEVDAYVYGENIAATRSLDVTGDEPKYRDTWAVTHVPTGMAFVHGLPLRVARALADRLATLGLNSVESEDPDQAADELKRLGGATMVEWVQERGSREKTSIPATVKALKTLTPAKAKKEIERARGQIRTAEARAEERQAKARAKEAAKRLKATIAAFKPSFWMHTTDVHWQSPKVFLTRERGPYASDRAHERVGGCTGTFTLVHGMDGDYQVSFQGYSPDKKGHGGPMSMNCMFIIDNTETLGRAKRAAQKVIASVLSPPPVHPSSTVGSGLAPKEVFYAVGTDDARKDNWRIFESVKPGQAVEVASLNMHGVFKVKKKDRKRLTLQLQPQAKGLPKGLARLTQSASARYYDTHPDEFFPGADLDLEFEIHSGPGKGKFHPLRFVRIVGGAPAEIGRPKKPARAAKRKPGRRRPPTPKPDVAPVEVDFLAAVARAERGGNPYAPPSDEELRAHLRRQIGDHERVYVELHQHAEAAVFAQAELVLTQREHDKRPSARTANRIESLESTVETNAAYVEGGLQQIGNAFGDSVEASFRRRLHEDLAGPREVRGRTMATGQSVLPGFWPRGEP
jgi:hypothetical protein